MEKITGSHDGWLDIQTDDAVSFGKIMDSGQCFRARIADTAENADTFMFITGDNIIYIRQNPDNLYDFSARCSEDEWKEIWHGYFDFDRKYDELIKAVDADDSYMTKSVSYGKGIRILRQDKWEMMISFIISQRKSIPAIRTSIERLCRLCGIRITDDIYAFPAPAAAASLKDTDLNACGMGYRTPYIMDAADKVTHGVLDLDAMSELSNEELYDTLLSVKGIGKKVANCIMLFAYARFDRSPVDVWMKRITDSVYGGDDPLLSEKYFKSAGIYQQYMFCYAISHKDMF